MFTGSTLGLRSLHALLSQLPCRHLLRSAISVRGHLLTLAPLLRSRVSSDSYHPRKQDGAPPTNSHQSSSAPALPSRRAVSANGTHYVGRLPSSLPAPSADKSRINHPVVVGSPSDAQDRQRHGSALPARSPRRALNRIKRKCPSQKRRTLLWVMLTARTPDRAWMAYEELLSYQAMIPHHLLHQLARLLASVKPRTRSVHLRLLSVLRTLARSHGQLRLWEWNTLIDSAGKQWHKTRMEDYENSLDIFNKRGVLLAGSTADGPTNAETNSCVTQQTPDIWTYNILLSIASRSNLPLTVRHASSLLLASGLTPNRYTHLCLLRYFAIRNDLRSVRSTLRKMKQQGLEVGIDGINACLWAYARNGRFDVALRVYRVLRSNVELTPDLGKYNEEDFCYIRDTIGLDVEGFEPDEITYTIMIQALAYHGDLGNALCIFVDMLSTPNREAVTLTDGITFDPVCYKPSMAAFSGLFLGFARHGRDPEPRTVDAKPVVTLYASPQAAWDQDTLETIFAAFLQLPSLPKLTDRVFYWILVAFDKTSSNDSAKLCEVWTKLETKYGGGRGGRLEEIRRSIFP